MFSTYGIVGPVMADMFKNAGADKSLSPWLA
jgi:hypothetical protein